MLYSFIFSISALSALTANKEKIQSVKYRSFMVQSSFLKMKLADKARVAETGTDISTDNKAQV